MAPLYHLSESTTTTATIPNDNTTSSVKHLAIYYDLVYVVMEDIMNCVKSHIAFSGWYPSWFLCSDVPGDHMLIFIT